MYLKMAKRVLVESDKRLLWKFMMNMGYRGIRSIELHKKRLKRGEYFPPFLHISVLNSCNLQCQGCWVDVKAKQQRIEPDRLSKLIGDAQAAGNAMFGILGGEPFMYRGLLDVLAEHPRAYFQVFTNGQLITDELAARMREIGNITPLISIEGDDVVSDERRGGEAVYSRSMQGVETCIRHKLITGVCTSLCQSNYESMLREEWVDRLIEIGAMYMWFHTYRPIGPDPNPQLALTPEQQLRVRKFVVEMRARKPIGIIDAYYDGQGQALCPATTAMSHHISPAGDIEPCPIIQFAKETIDDERGIKRTMVESEFLHEFREMAAATTRGCIVLENPDALKALMIKHGARDTTVRQSAMQELAALEARPSQHNPGHEIPEKNLIYRWAKKYWFSDFGAYASR